MNRPPHSAGTRLGSTPPRSAQVSITPTVTRARVVRPAIPVVPARRGRAVAVSIRQRRLWLGSLSLFALLLAALIWELVAHPGGWAIGAAALAAAGLLTTSWRWARLAADLGEVKEQTVRDMHDTRHAGERRLAALMGGTSDVVLVLDTAGRVTFCSRASLTVLDRSPGSVRGLPVDDLLTDEDGPRLRAALTGLTEGTQARLELLAVRGDGGLVPVEAAITSHLADSFIAGYVVGLRDMSEVSQFTAELARQSLHDPLTGLPNRRLFNGLVAQAIRGDDEVAVIVADLDDFKSVNTRHGQLAGDAVLVEISARMRDVLRADDVVARLGGDEFGILITGSHDQQLGSRLLAAVSAPITVEDREISIRVSLGVATAEPGLTVEDLMRHADVAMYWAKESGRSSLARYEADLHHRALDQMVLRHDLERAIRAGELRLVFQSIIDLKTGRVHGVEALARWDHPLRGMVSPDEFVPLAEQSGMMVELGTWILREACRSAVRMQRPGAPVMMSVNISALQLSQPDFAVNLLSVLDEFGLDPGLLLLEITETAVVISLDRVIPRLAALRCLGVHVSIDDFGTGYSSLNYLSRLPLDELKVDKSFVDRLVSDPQTQSVVRAMLDMSNSLGLITVGEGIESQEQADWLRAAGCTLGQGFLWARPQEEHQVLTALGIDVNQPSGG